MAVFNLAKFPDVCRVCMKPESKQLMLRLDGTSRRRCGGGGDSLEKFLDEVTFRVPEHKIGCLPKMVCTGCSEELQRFATFRRRLILTLQFMEALIDLKSDSNSEPLSKLFRSNQRELDALFKELSLCNKEEALVDDLLEEFTSYEFATMPLEFTIKEEAPVVEFGADDDDFRPADDDGGASDGSSSEDIKPEMVLVASEQDSDSSSSSSSSSSTSASSDAPRKKKTSRRGHNFKKKPETTGQRRGRGRPRIYADGTFLKEPWACDKCKFTTKYRNAVERHKNVHLKRENKIYPCTDCKEVFKTYDEMRNHSLTHPENQVVCEVCGIALKNSYSLKAHMERHEDGRKFSCEYCDYTAQTSLSLKAHIQGSHIRDNWNKRCEVCGVVFRTSSRLKRHMESHDNERKYACDQCPARFNTSNALRNHRTRVHLAIRHACEHCDKTYDQKIALRDHVERVHHIQCTFICDVCVQTFDSQDKLDAHRTRHANPKPLECSICLALHTTQQDFDGHQCITYQEHYFCCGKDLRNHLQYNKHMMVKHNLKTNARVKPVPGILLGELRGARKRLEQCRKCDIAFPTRALKLAHLAICSQQQGATSEKVPLPDPVPVHVPVPPVPVILPPQAAPPGQMHQMQQQHQPQPTMMMEIDGSGGVSTAGGF